VRPMREHVVRSIWLSYMVSSAKVARTFGLDCAHTFRARSYLKNCACTDVDHSIGGKSRSLS
jgi:hypothetical protein